MVHHEDDARVRLDLRQRPIVGVPHADPVEKLNGAPRHEVADPEVEPGVERRHDLARIALDLAGQGRPRHPGFPRLAFERLHHLGITGQPLDENLAPGPGGRRVSGASAAYSARRSPRLARRRSTQRAPGMKTRSRTAPQHERAGRDRDPDRKGDRLRHRDGGRLAAPRVR